MKKTYLFLIILLGIQLFFLINLQFTAWPEMFSYPYLRNNGFLLYRDMIHPYPPLLTMGLSTIYKVFGYRLEVLQVVAWSLALLNSTLVFLIAHSLTKSVKTSLVTLAFYVLFQPFLEGNMLWFDTAIVPLILLALFFASRWSQKIGDGRWNLISAGLFFAVAALIKQTAAIFLIFFLIFVFFRSKRKREALYLFLGSVLLLTPLFVRLAQEGALLDFWRWTVWYPLTEWGNFPGYVQMTIGKHDAIILVLLLAPLTLLLVRAKLLKDANLRLLLLMLAGGLIAVYPRFSFFHFQPALTFLAIVYAFLFNRLKKAHMFLVSCYLLLVTVFIARPVLTQDWQKEARFFGQEDKMLAQKIKDATLQGERVFLLGLHSNVYSIAGVLPPKRWTDNFGWYLESAGVQEEILLWWENNPPALVFWRTPSQGNWFDLGTYQPRKIAAWVEEHYTKDKEVKPGIWLWTLRQVQGKQ